jgi:hypothetical protein
VAVPAPSLLQDAHTHLQAGRAPQRRKKRKRRRRRRRWR